MTETVASIWAATANSAPETPALNGGHTADVAVVGAGYTGLTAALRLAEGGARVIAIDAAAPGFGASGRNGGQVIPGLKYDPDVLDAVYGEATTEFVGKAADTVFALIEKYAIDCEPVRKGWIQASVKRSHLPTLESRANQWKSRGAPARMLDAAEMAARTGANGFVGGWLDGRAGSLHPLNYARGLARAALTAGAKIHGHSRATALRKDGRRWIVEIAGGARITAEEVVVATNGYSDALWPDLKATVIPANSFQVADGAPRRGLARTHPARALRRVQLAPHRQLFPRRSGRPPDDGRTRILPQSSLDRRLSPDCRRAARFLPREPIGAA